LTKEKNVITNLENIFFYSVPSTVFVFSRRKKYRFGTTWGWV